MNLSLPLPLVEIILRLPFLRRPTYLVKRVSEAPIPTELSNRLLLFEVRGGFPKWVHFRCPKCGDHIQLPMVGKNKWMLRVDYLQRPTLMPSIWELNSCGAHFFIRSGEVAWYRE